MSGLINTPEELSEHYSTSTQAHITQHAARRLREQPALEEMHRTVLRLGKVHWPYMPGDGVTPGQCGSSLHADHGGLQPHEAAWLRKSPSITRVARLQTDCLASLGPCLDRPRCMPGSVLNCSKLYMAISMVVTASPTAGTSTAY